MPNLEIHYRKGVEKKIGFETLGEVCQIALSQAFNKANEANTDPTDVLVRFVEASRWDRGIPDICFVIKCGEDGLTHNQQLDLCLSFCRCEPIFGYSIDTVCAQNNLSLDVEIFNKRSHGVSYDACGDHYGSF
ncbi:hypothetical protein FWF89_01435 [Candidatus Saccharibacteria bacterium]|nr:hypothetical protein [Candidatus Saccharibacteria bacterium]